VKNTEVATIFQDIADFLDIKGESPFKVRAYQRVARSIEHSPQEVEQLMNEGKLGDIPGVGEAIAKKITELVTTGHLEYYDKLRAEFPPGVNTLLDIPGIGPRTAMRLSTELEIKSLEELEAAIREGKVASLYRMGDKTAENILRHVQAMRSKEQRLPIGEALPLVEDIITSLGHCPGLENLTSAGSLRRFRETIGDIDLMGTAEDKDKILEAFVRLPQTKEVLSCGGTKASIITQADIQVDLRVVEHDCFGSLLQYFTGSKQHNITLRERGHRQGLKLSEYGIQSRTTGLLEKFATEEEFYRRLGLEFIPPELREGQIEIEKAEQWAIPELIKLSDIKGDLHVHTNWSDGHDSIEAMALAARDLGYQYLAITDHSAGRGIAHGLNEERVREQIVQINTLNQRLNGIHLFSGVEVDIRADGNLDLPDDLLRELDIVIAGVHSAMGQEEEKMTRRILRAIENPHVDVLAHPTCRLLGGREPVSVDLEAVFKAAARTNTALEINSMPDRLDLKDTHVFRARELGIKLLINTDAHSTKHLEYMRFGVGVARRGWCEARHVLNTIPLAELSALFTSPRSSSA